MTDLFLKLFRNKYINNIIFNEIKESNIKLKYIRFNYYDIPISTIINTNNKSLLIEKLNDNNHNNNNKIKFDNGEWFKLLLEWKELDLNLFQIIYNKFKIEIFDYLNNDIENQISTIISLIKSNNLIILNEIFNNILKYDESKYKSLLLHHGILKVFQVSNYLESNDGLIPINIFKSFLVYNNLVSNQQFTETIKNFYTMYCYYKYRINNDTSTDNEYKEYLNLFFEHLNQSNQSNQSNLKIQKALLLRLAIRKDDHTIFNFLFKEYLDIQQQQQQEDGTGLNKLIKISNRLSIRLSDIMDYDNLENQEESIYYSLCGKMKSLKCAQFEIVKTLITQLPEEFTNYHKQIDDPYIFNFLFQKRIDTSTETSSTSNNTYTNYGGVAFENYFNNSTTNISTNCLCDNLENSSTFLSYQIDVLRPVTNDTNPSVEKLKFIFENCYWERNHLFDYFTNIPNLNNNLSLVKLLISNTTFVKFNVETLIQISKNGYNNIIDEIILQRSRLLYKTGNLNETRKTITIILLTAIFEECTYLFNQLFEIAKQEGLISFKNLIDKVFLEKLPNDRYKRRLFLINLNLLLLNSIEKTSGDINNSNNSLDEIDEFIKNNLDSKNLTKFSMEYLINLNGSILIQMMDKNGAFKLLIIKYLIDSNNQCLLNYISPIIEKFKHEFFGYSISQYKFEINSFVNLSNSFKFSIENDLPKVLEYIISKENYLLIDYILSINQFNINQQEYFFNQLTTKDDNRNNLKFKNNFNYFLNFCNLQILIFTLKYLKKNNILLHLLKSNYNYSITHIEDDILLKLNNFKSQILDDENLLLFYKKIGFYNFLNKK